MLSLLRSNNPSIVLLYVIYLIAFRISAIWSTTPPLVVADSSPISFVIFNYLQQFSGLGWLSLLLAAALTFVQALLVNLIINENKITAKKNYLGGGVHIVFVSFFTEGIYLSPALIAATFILLMLRSLFLLAKADKQNGNIFNLGFMISLAALFYFPTWGFLLFLMLGLGTVRPFVFREWIILLLGVIAPLFVLFTIFFYNDLSLPTVTLHNWTLGVQISELMKIQLVFLGVIALFVIVTSQSALRGVAIQVRKFSSLLQFSLFITIGTFFLQVNLHWSHAVWLAIPLSILLTMFLLLIRRIVWAEILHSVLILIIIAFQIIPHF